MKKFFKRFGKRITSIFLTVIIIIISCVYPFFSVSAFAAEVTLFALGSLIWSVAGGVLTGGAFTSAESVTSAITDIYNDGLAAGDTVCTAFEANPIGTVNSLLGYVLPLVQGVPKDLANSDTFSSACERIIGDKNGGVAVPHTAMQSMRAEIISSVNDGKEVVYSDNGYTVYSDGQASITLGNNTYNIISFPFGTDVLFSSLGYNLGAVPVFYNDTTVYSAYFIELYIQNWSTRIWYNLSQSDSNKSYVLNTPNNLSVRTSDTGSSICIQVVNDGSVVKSDYYSTRFVDSFSCITTGLNVSYSSLDFSNLRFGYIIDTYATNCSNSDFYHTLLSASTGSLDIGEKTVDSVISPSGIENTVLTGQGLGVVSENPTITFVPVTAADGTTTVDTLIDDVPVAEVEKTIADIGEFNDTFADSLPDISDNWTTISIPSTSSPDINTPLGMLKQKLTSKFPVIDQLNTFFNNLFNTDYDSTAPNFHFYWDSNGDGEVERYNALDLSFLETTLTNEYLEDKDRFAAPINLRLFIHLIIILIVYVQFAVKLFKMLPSFFGFGSDFTGNIVTEISREPDTRYHDTGIGFKG